MTENTKQPGKDGGYDSAVHGQEDDHLNRWPFAKEIYGVATTGPREWSLRIGVYGEWGSGKTSILNFVDTLARRDGHIVVRFNPWEYRNNKDLWHAFVQTVSAVLPPEALASWAARRSLLKKRFVPIAKFLSLHGGRISEAVDDKRVTLGVIGLDLLKDFIFSNRSDLEDALSRLGGKRLIVLIDDLDRTSPELVPEMLFAIKEIMDVGGVAFVCAFDPVVVGEVLAGAHPGFRDGLKFLEKIIDYPRWLPDPTRDALLALARHDIGKHCPYVPIQAMDQTIPLLPRNPRALRQFIRLTALLRPQIHRHHERELVWPVILAANVVKLRFPKLANPLLKAPDFWKQIYDATLMGKDDEGEKVNKILTEHTHRAIALQHMSEETGIADQIAFVMKVLAERAKAWTGLDLRSLEYQMHIAEAPAAVTWKEFDAFIAVWESDRSKESADSWIRNHCKAVGRVYQEVYQEVLDAAIRERQIALSRAAEVIAEESMDPMLKIADVRMAVLECLVLKLGDLDKPNKKLGEKQFEQIFEAMTYYLEWINTEVYRALREREKTFILRVANEWLHDVTPMIRTLKPFSDILAFHFHGQTVKTLHRQLCELVVPRYARQVLERLRQQGFIIQVYGREEGLYEATCLLLDPTGPLWGGLRKEALEVLASAKEDQIVQQNSYEMLHWFDYILEKEANFEKGQAVQRWLKDGQLRAALWVAATSHPLNPRAVGSLKKLLGTLDKIGAPVELPDWWRRSVEELGREKSETKTDG